MKTWFSVFLMFLITLMGGCKKATCPEPEISNPSETQKVTLITNWEQKNNGLSGYLYAVDFLNARTGYISGLDGVVYKTTDGGDSYQSLTTALPTTYDSYVMDFVDENIGYVGANDGLADGKLRKTVDGGQSWQDVPVSATVWRMIKFVTPSLGFVGGGVLNDIPYQGGQFFRTTDGGQTWSTITIANLKTVRCVFFVDNTTGFMCSTGGHIYKTTDAGVNWTELNLNLNTGIPESQIYTSSIFFKNANDGFCFTNTTFANDGFLMRTMDGGTTWTRVILPPSGYGDYNFYPEIKFTSDQIGYISGGNTGTQTGSLLTTTDGGTTWSIFTLPVGTKRLALMSFPEPGVGYIVGENSTVLKGISQ